MKSERTTLRKRAGFTLQGLVQKVGTNTAYISQWELDPKVVEKISKVITAELNRIQATDVPLALLGAGE
jgi:hypothetical protein